MTDQVKRALELVDIWQKEYISQNNFYNTLNFSNPTASLGHIADAAKIASFFSQVINQVQQNLADEAKIRELFKDDMEKLIKFYYNMCDDNRPFEKIKDFLNKSNS